MQTELDLHLNSRGGLQIRKSCGRYYFNWIYICSVLFDSGAWYCFTLSTFIIQYRIPFIILGLGLNINTVNGIIVSSELCRHCPIVLDNREFHVDLFILKHCDFDMILSMNWLSGSYVVIDCRRRAIVFQIPN